jgi:hypothetical protein
MRKQRETATQVRERFERAAQDREAKAVKKFANDYFRKLKEGTVKIIGPEKDFVREEKLVLIKKKSSSLS